MDPGTIASDPREERDMKRRDLSPGLLDLDRGRRARRPERRAVERVPRLGNKSSFLEEARRVTRWPGRRSLLPYVHEWRVLALYEWRVLLIWVTDMCSLEMCFVGANTLVTCFDFTRLWSDTSDAFQFQVISFVQFWDNEWRRQPSSTPNVRFWTHRHNLTRQRLPRLLLSSNPLNH